MPNTTVPFNAEVFSLMLTVAAKEYPEGDKRLKNKTGKRITPLSKLIQDASIERTIVLAKKHKVTIPRKIILEAKI